MYIYRRVPLNVETAVLLVRKYDKENNIFSFRRRQVIDAALDSILLKASKLRVKFPLIYLEEECAVKYPANQVKSWKLFCVLAKYNKNILYAGIIDRNMDTVMEKNNVRLRGKIKFHEVVSKITEAVVEIGNAVIGVGDKKVVNQHGNACLQYND